MVEHSDGCRHPRITKAYAKSLIVEEKSIIETSMSVVIYIVRLKNNHRFVGDAIVANPSAFEAEKGLAIAKAKVIDQIMKAEMYQLRTKLNETRT